MLVAAEPSSTMGVVGNGVARGRRTPSPKRLNGPAERSVADMPLPLVENLMVDLAMQGAVTLAAEADRGFKMPHPKDTAAPKANSQGSHTTQTQRDLASPNPCPGTAERVVSPHVAQRPAVSSASQAKQTAPPLITSQARQSYTNGEFRKYYAKQLTLFHLKISYNISMFE